MVKSPDSNIKHSDFKCEKCGGGGEKRYSTFHKEKCLCKGKRSATQITPLEVPEGYKFYKLTKNKVWFANGWGVENARFIELPHKIGDIETFVCEVCGGSWYYKCMVCVYKGYCPIDVGKACTKKCPQCQGLPEIEATLVSIEVKDNNLIERWEEV